MDHVAIIGGGLGGLTLAKVLQVRGVPCTVYELEASPSIRTQGGTLDLKKESGQRALELANLTKEFEAIARPEGDAFRIAGKDGRVQFAMEGTDILDGFEAVEKAEKQRSETEKSEISQYVPEKNATNTWGDTIRPEVDRGMLRQLFLDSLAPETIKWGHKLISLSTINLPLTYPKHQLKFSNGVAITADVVVGADGAWSLVRSAISLAQPEYTGVTMVEVQMSDVDARFPELAKMIGPGSYFGIDNNKALVAQRNAHSHVRTYIALRVTEDWTKTSNIPFATDPTETRIRLLEYFQDWVPELKKLVELCDDVIVPRGIYQLPIAPKCTSRSKWEHKQGITVLGDAAHLMTPFAGEGANLAMLDGAELAVAIASVFSFDSAAMLDNAIIGYEQEMFARGNAAAGESDSNMTEFISEGGLARAVAVMRKVTSGMGPPDGRK